MKNNQDNLKYQVMGGMFWKLSERILAQGVSFLVSVVLARMLTPDEYGIVAIVLVLISLANVFVTSGFSVALVQNKNSKDIDFSTNFWCSIAVSVCIYFLLFIIAPLIELFYDIKGLTSVIRVFGLIIPLSAFSAIQHAYVERNMLFKKYFFSTLFGTVVSGITGIVMAMYGMGVWALVFQYFTNTAVDIIVLLFTVNWRPKFEFSILSAKHMMSYGWKILVADFFGTFFEQLRSLIVGKVYSSSDLAFYNKGNQLPTLITTNVSSSIMTVLFPAIANISDNYERVYQITRRAVQVVAYIMFPLLFGLAAVSDNLVLILFTEKWLPASIFVKRGRRKGERG
ncbi:lipopolysaccharide biosynthesis protein, partial [Enterococcus faecium]|uniref:lipopolysaccharide biosynthesis protein n=1 Tax=Enterococcus faecium TaxID=1352 RepID=UPI000C020742